MLDQLAKTLQNLCQLEPDSPLLVGVSGGADSYGLLDGLNRLGYPLVVAHFDHQLRPESSSDARIVRLVAESRGIPFVLGEQSVAEYARTQNQSIEEAAREVRYRFLFEQAQIHGAQAVVVAHNADDQVETVLMHLLRGSGLDGLTGMAYRALPNPWSDSIPLVRPLLGTWREEIETYCQERGLTPLRDRSNLDITFFRNRLRHELLPELETYVPGIRQRLWQTADLLSADRALLDQLTDESWSQFIEDAGDGYATFNLPAFSLHPLALKRRLIRKAVSRLRPGARDVDFALVQRVLDFSMHPTATNQADLGLGLRVFLENQNLTIAAWEADLPDAHWPQLQMPSSSSQVSRFMLPLPLPGEVNLGDGWFLRAEISEDIESARVEAEGNRDPFKAWIDLRDRQPSLMLRPRLPGDRFRPLGLGGKSTKLSDFMINLKIPQRARQGWPLVCAGDEILWVPGYRLAHPFRLTGETRRAILLTLEKR